MPAHAQNTRLVDSALHETFVGGVLYLPRGPVRGGGGPVPSYSTDLGAAKTLLDEVFPGFILEIESRSTRDHIRIAPDFDHPDFGEIWRRVWADGDDFSVDISTSPGGRPAHLLCGVILAAAVALQEGKTPASHLEAFEALCARTFEKNRVPETKISIPDLISKIARPPEPC